MGVKVGPVWRPDSTGAVRETKVKEALTAEYDADLKLKFALQRRSLAFDQCRLVSKAYQEFEKWSCVLLEACAAPPLEGYHKASVEQL